MTVETFTTQGTGTWTCPTGVTSVDVELWGGGGCSGVASTAGAGGGGGGAYAKKTLSVTPGVGYSYQVGNGGLTVGTAAKPSWFSSTGTAFAAFGARGAAGTGSGGAGGAGGTAAGSIGDTKFSGGAGGNGASGGGGGGGGGSGGTAANGNTGTNAVTSTGGAGATAVTNGGAGGAGGNTSNNGVAGVQPGGGTGGDGAGAADGSNGAVGKMVLTYTLPPPSLGSLGTTAWTINRAYSSTITISGGTAPYGSLTQSGLPNGITASLSGSTITLSGTPTVANTFASVQIGVTDAAAATASRTYSITINVAPTLGSLSVTTGTVNVAYSGTISISGGTSPYGSLTQSGLPTGLTASLGGSTITISGTPTVAGPYASVQIGITDTAGDTASGTYSITISSGSTGSNALLLTGVG